MSGRVSMQPRHETNALPPDQRWAVAALEHHLWKRQHCRYPLFELLTDGTLGTFITIGYFQECLREVGAPKHGEDYAAACLNTILPALGLIEDSGTAKKPRAPDLQERNPFRQNPNPEGGRAAQLDPEHSYWWRVFRLPTLTRYITPRAGAYRIGEFWGARWDLASLVGLLRCQGLIPGRRRRRDFAYGSVQAAFHATGPP
jgi:hypothetical protein